MKNNAIDRDVEETIDWVDAFEAVIEHQGPQRARFLLKKIMDEAIKNGILVPHSATTPYVNTIKPDNEQPSPGDHEIEHSIRSYVRWNALAMVIRANQKPGDLGGHIASFASSATLYDVGYNHFFRGSIKNGDESLPGDLVYFQGHTAPGVYARAYLSGRLNEGQLDKFRMEVKGGGLSSYPHPWLMPSFWQFPTVSMGLGPIMAIYQARFMKYLENRQLIPKSNRKIWAFVGDGEMDEPESLGAISLAAREGLDNLIFVVNCNLQRLDGPVRGNGKIIQELEGAFRGAGWNAIKVIWGSYWDDLLRRDEKGLLQKRMEEALDGDYQTYRANSGDYIRKHFFGKYPELHAMVNSMTDADIWRLNRGGHDPHKIFAAYHSAFNSKDEKPTVILAKTIKGYHLGADGEARNTAHQQKKISLETLKKAQQRWKIPLSEEEIEKAAYYRPDPDSKESKYLHQRIEEMGGMLPERKTKVDSFKIPDNIFDGMHQSSGERTFSTTMAFVRLLSALVRDKSLGKYVVPIVPDESRTFGMEGMFRQLGIYSRLGQLYSPEDADELMYYREDQKGQILQEGICEAGAMSSWMAAATAYSNYGLQMIPFYIFYSMFGFQRVGDLAWAAGDMRSRGFLLGATSGRTTLNGEGLQHEDGHSQIQAQLIPNCRSYDPTFGYELAIIMHDGLVRMFDEQRDEFYYITLMNENYSHPALPDDIDVRENILKGGYLLRCSTGDESQPKIRLLGCGAILNESLRAADMLEEKFNIRADVYSITSFNHLARDGQECQRWNLHNPDKEQKVPHISKLLMGDDAPVIAATDYIKLFSDQIRGFVPADYIVLGTDGFGRSDTRQNLRQHFEVSSDYIVFAAVSALAKQEKIETTMLAKVVKELGIDTDKANPLYQ